MQLNNSNNVQIGQHLVFDGQDYRLTLTAAGTKTGRRYVAAVPHELTPYMNLWLEAHRVQLTARRRDPVRGIGAPSGSTALAVR